MAYLIDYEDDWREGYVDLTQKVIRAGARKGSRNGAVAEIRDFMFTLGPGASDLPFGVGRALSSGLAAAEAIQLCAGVAMPQLTESVSASVASYVRDPDGTVHGNYGGRVGLQIVDVIEKLTSDRESRQAVIQIWDRGLDSRHRLPMPKDIPCTLSIVLSITPGTTLTMSVMMRSSDVWLGIPYDVFQFRQLQRTIAHLLGCGLGQYSHHSVSMHAYEKDWTAISELSERPHGHTFQPYGLIAGRAKDLPEVMREILAGRDVSNESHAWYHKCLGAAYATTLG